MTLSKVVHSSKSQEYGTPKYLYDRLDAVFNFELDPCTTEDNPLGAKYFYTEEMDGLAQDWSFAKSIFINPPYGPEVNKWVKKASESVASNPGQIIVMLIASRTGTERFHRYIYNKPDVDTVYLRGRLKFVGEENGAPFDSMISVFRGELRIQNICITANIATPSVITKAKLC